MQLEHFWHLRYPRPVWLNIGSLTGEKNWWLKATINGLGALVTCITLIIIGISKFISGAWITVLLIPFMVAIFLQVQKHYREVAEQLSMKNASHSKRSFGPLRVVVPISGVHRGDSDAVDFALSISQSVTAVYIELEPGTGEQIQEKWGQWWPEVPLVVVPSPYRSIIEPLLRFLDELDTQQDDGQLAAVILPEFVPAKWWQSLLHNQTAWFIKTALLYRRRYLGYQRVIMDVPYHLQR